jgi:3-oxoacyl-(acyl-carrier-protein) synthase
MTASVVLTGMGMVTPLGTDPAEVLRRIRAGETAAAPPARFDASPFACPLAAEVRDFAPEDHVPDPKTLRLMGRDARFAAAAARAALAHAGIAAGREYPAEEIGLFGATGLAGMDLEDVEPLIRSSAGTGGAFDPRRFGEEALKRVRPILSFRILGNMPICFVSIFEGIRGPNAVYNPWEGQGARAIVRGIAAVRRGEAACALAGGCDAKTGQLAFVGLEQAGAFRPWAESGRGAVPGEGAAFLVLEEEGRARARGARIIARFRAAAIRTASEGSPLDAARVHVLRDLSPRPGAALVSGEEGDGAAAHAEEKVLGRDRSVPAEAAIRPKIHLGNLYAAAAAVQVCLAAAMLAGGAADAIAACFGHGSEQGAFLLERT